MRFLIERPAWIDGTYIDARVQDPKIVELADDADVNNVSRLWKPMDEAAKAALAKLKKVSEIVKPEVLVAKVRAEAATMAEAQRGKKANRNAEDAAVRSVTEVTDVSVQPVASIAVVK